MGLPVCSPRLYSLPHLRQEHPVSSPTSHTWGLLYSLPPYTLGPNLRIGALCNSPCTQDPCAPPVTNGNTTYYFLHRGPLHPISTHMGPYHISLSTSNPSMPPHKRQYGSLRPRHT
uniref:Uncharacterized protein n=1 Tax=Pyxicephalus adspersus TaxID=30357 RepID=A0AAV2ZV90_PYXAD|nr:TPA: hypothetical protein GDO54_003944 [Pyxicephalus adspersus]